MEKYLVDTNIIVDYSKGKEKAASFLNSLDEFIVSVITVGEVYQRVRSRKELEFAKQLFAFAKVLPINEHISSLTLKLLEKYTLSHGLLILDAFIAATAIRHNLTLTTGNIKHFRMIKELKVEKW